MYRNRLALAVSVSLLLAVTSAMPQTRGPAVFASGVISTDAEEYRVSFTHDGATVYFARSAAPFAASRQSSIYSTTFKAGAWSTPQVVPFSGKYPDLDPFVSPDDSKIYFSSIRPVNGAERKDADLWVVEKTATGWGEPRNLGAVNSTADELSPSVSLDGTLYFSSDRKGGAGSWDLYTAKPQTAGGYAPATNIEIFNTLYWEVDPVVTADGRMIAFSAFNRPGGEGLGDLFVAHRYENRWLPPRSVGKLVNTAADETRPSFSPNGKFLFFVRRAAGATARAGDVYAVSLGSLGQSIGTPQLEHPRLGSPDIPAAADKP